MHRKYLFTKITDARLQQSRDGNWESGAGRASTPLRTSEVWALAGSAAQSDGLARAATLEHVIAPHLLELVQYWTYRLGGFVLVNVLDDPAWLAMIFC